MVIAGSMFAGKTEELIRLLRRALYARENVQVFKHALDTRSETVNIRSHDGTLHEAHAVSKSGKIPAEIKASTDLIAIEEAQFFDDGIVKVCGDLTDRGYAVIVPGLDMNFRGLLFGPMPALPRGVESAEKLSVKRASKAGVAGKENKRCS